MPVIRTSEGTLVKATPPGQEFTQEQAEADALDRNERAKKLEIKTRYVVADE